MTKAKKKTVAAVLEATAPVAVPAAVDQTAILVELMAELKQMRADHAAEREQFAGELLQAKLAAEAAAAVHVDDPFRPNAMPDNAIDPRTDRPGTLAEKLHIMQEEAEAQGRTFDRELTRRSLLGLPVADVNKFVFGGHAFENEADLLAYKEKIEAEKLATIGKYLR